MSEVTYLIVIGTQRSAGVAMAAGLRLLEVGARLGSLALVQEAGKEAGFPIAAPCLVAADAAVLWALGTPLAELLRYAVAWPWPTRSFASDWAGAPLHISAAAFYELRAAGAIAVWVAVPDVARAASWPLWWPAAASALLLLPAAALLLPREAAEPPELQLRAMARAVNAS